MPASRSEISNNKSPFGLSCHIFVQIISNRLSAAILLVVRERNAISFLSWAKNSLLTLFKALSLFDLRFISNFFPATRIKYWELVHKE